jgi:hypothetical protein
MARRRFRRDSADYRKAHWEGPTAEYLDRPNAGKQIVPHTFEVAAAWTLTSRISPQFQGKEPFFRRQRPLMAPRLNCKLRIVISAAKDRRDKT